VPERISPARRFAFALGNAGFQLGDRVVVAIAVYFYLPPPGRGLVPQIPERVFFGFLTLYGLAMLVGRVFDSISDPVVGWASDRSRARLGRRRTFLVAGVLPMVVIPALLFFPPGAPGSAANTAWLFGLLSLYFVFFTVYVAPYLALIPEIAWTQRERLTLGTLLALVSLPVAGLFGSAWPLSIDLGRAAGLEPAASLRVLVVVASLLALVLCLAPILAVDERRFARSVPSPLSFRGAVTRTLRDRAFCIYLVSQGLFVFGLNVIQPLTPYLATVVLGRSEGFAAWFGLATFVGVGLGFAAIHPIVRRLGPKRVMALCSAVFGLALCGLGLLRADAPGGPDDARNLALVFGALGVIGIPIAGFFVIPNVLIAQMIDRDERDGGSQRSAMYYGIQGFLTKWIYGVSLWVLTLLLARFGNSPEQPFGVILAGPVAGVACLLSAAVLSAYPEREVLAATARTLPAEAGREPAAPR
jgi:GPH family glycoside/pentoside/hexuronide:cation symporter